MNSCNVQDLLSDLAIFEESDRNCQFFCEVWHVLVYFFISWKLIWSYFPFTKCSPLCLLYIKQTVADEKKNHNIYEQDHLTVGNYSQVLSALGTFQVFLLCVGIAAVQNANGPAVTQGSSACFIQDVFKTDGIHTCHILSIPASVHTMGLIWFCRMFIPLHSNKIGFPWPFLADRWYVKKKKSP